MGITRQQEEELLRRLARGRLIARARCGLYLIPPRLPVGGSWSPDEVLALNTLIEDRGGRYQICGPNAFNRYGFDDQIPTRVYAYNDRISGERTIGSISLTLIKVPSHYFNGRFIPLPEENFRSDAERGRPGRHRRDRMAVGPLNPMIHFLENVMMAGGLLQIVALARGRSA